MATTRYVARKSAVDQGVWQRFTAANATLRGMYEEWIGEICSVARKRDSVTDIACNTGYFLQRFAQLGFGTCIGYDRFDKSEVFGLLNRILGTHVEFRHEEYDSWRHTVSGCQPAGVVIASAIMIHLSDPLYFLKFLGDITEDVLFLFTSIAHKEDYSIHYHPPISTTRETGFLFVLT